MTIHGAPFSPYSISPPCCEIMLPPYTHTRMHKRGWAKACTRSAHCCSSFISTFQKSSCFLLFPLPSSATKTWFIQLPAFNHGKRAAEGGAENTLIKPAAPSGFSTSEHRSLPPFSKITQEITLKSLRRYRSDLALSTRLWMFGVANTAQPEFPFFFLP